MKLDALWFHFIFALKRHFLPSSLWAVGVVEKVRRQHVRMEGIRFWLKDILLEWVYVFVVYFLVTLLKITLWVFAFLRFSLVGIENVNEFIKELKVQLFVFLDFFGKLTSIKQIIEFPNHLGNLTIEEPEHWIKVKSTVLRLVDHVEVFWWQSIDLCRIRLGFLVEKPDYKADKVSNRPIKTIFYFVLSSDIKNSLPPRKHFLNQIPLSFVFLVWFIKNLQFSFWPFIIVDFRVEEIDPFLPALGFWPVKAPLFKNSWNILPLFGIEDRNEFLKKVNFLYYYHKRTYWLH